MTYRNGNDLSTKIGAAFVLVFCICSLVVCGNWHDWNGANQQQAEKHAKAFAAELVEHGQDVELMHCDKHDTDGDGYVSCTFLFDSKPATWECAGEAYIDRNTGCREPKMQVRGGN